MVLTCVGTQKLRAAGSRDDEISTDAEKFPKFFEALSRGIAKIKLHAIDVHSS